MSLLFGGMRQGMHLLGFQPFSQCSPARVAESLDQMMQNSSGEAGSLGAAHVYHLAPCQIHRGPEIRGPVPVLGNGTAEKGNDTNNYKKMQSTEGSLKGGVISLS